MNTSDGQLVGPNPIHTYDLALAKESLKKLTALDVETVVCYHGGAFRNHANHVNQRISEFF